MPEARMIQDFQQALERDGREEPQRLFKQFEGMLTEVRMIGREGSMVDASFVEIPP